VNIIAGSTSVTVMFKVHDNDGEPLDGLTWNDVSLKSYYTRTGAAPVVINRATQTATGSYTSGGFVAVGTDQPGVYRFDIPNAAFAGGARQVVISLYGATNMQQADLRVELVADLADEISTATSYIVTQVNSQTEASEAAVLAEVTRIPRADVELAPGEAARHERIGGGTAIDDVEIKAVP
jgi:hypothetical protein